ncbi:MAG: hypothetical protein GDA39_09455 [Hyphomonadaceae bacterium]|nr:hypothetical protein [Hyphomonadaceae bacterium]MBC6413065.1 hypothetical protein [Hyphomonadaceae bacterium]
MAEAFLEPTKATQGLAKICTFPQTEISGGDEAHPQFGMSLHFPIRLCNRRKPDAGSASQSGRLRG